MKNIYLKTILISATLACRSLNAQWSATGGLTDLANALVVYNGNLYAGGTFLQADGNTVNNIAKWNGTAWSSLMSGMNDRVNALATYSNELYAAGDFTTAGGSTARHIAKWNGTAWSALLTNTAMVGPAHALCVYNNELYVEASSGGNDAGTLFKWNGTSWTTIANFDDRINKMEVFANELYVVGKFTMAGSIAANRIVKYNGSTFSAVGAGFNNSVYAIASYSNELYVGGSFSSSGTTILPNIAKWNGSAWVAVAAGPDGWVIDLKTYNGRLYAGGTFNNAGGNTAKNIASWNGTNWATLAGGTNNIVFSLGTYNGDLFASGTFTLAGAITVTNVARWNETASANAIHENSFTLSDVYVFPVPAKDVITLNVDLKLEGAIYNYQGQMVKTVFASVNNTIIVSDLQPGLYFLREVDSGKAIRFIKE